MTIFYLKCEAVWFFENVILTNAIAPASTLADLFAVFFGFAKTSATQAKAHFELVA